MPTPRWSGKGPNSRAFAEAQRLVVVAIEEEGRLHPGVLPLGWSEPDFASQLEDTASRSDPVRKAAAKAALVPAGRGRPSP